MGCIKCKDTNAQLNKFQNFNVTIRITLLGKIQKNILLKLYNVTVISTYISWI